MVITPYEKNAKKHPKKQIEQVAASIKEFGMNQPIVVDKQGVIIVGHGRFEALKHLGWEIKDEYIKVVDLTEEQAKAYRLADNKLNESEWDMALVIEELKGLSDEMLELSGFDSDIIIEADEMDDEVPDVPEEPVSQLGDLYELGGHRVLCGDSTKIEDVERLMNGKKADMVFTDPPYGVEYEGRKKFDVLLGDSKDESLDFLCDATTNLLSYMKTGGAFYMCVGWPTISTFLNTLEKYEELNLSTKLVWVKNTIGWGFADYRTSSEVILYGFKNGAKHFWAGGRGERDVWNFDKDNSKEYKHPTQKPIELVAKAITNSSKGDDIILDLFLGSGSTLIASEKTGRICCGMELDPKYVDVIVQRYCEYTGNYNIRKNGEDIVWQKEKGNQ